MEEKVIEQETNQNKKGHHPRVYVIMVIILVLTVIVAWAGNVIKGYVDSFVMHGDGEAEAISYMEGRNVTDATTAEALGASTDAWEVFRASHLWDGVTVTAEDGTVLSGVFYDCGATETVIVFPMFGNTTESRFTLGEIFANRETNILLVDLRGEGDSGDAACGFGYTEAMDVTAWVDYVNQMTQGEILLYGEGMGANAILFALADETVAQSVSLVIAESPYASFHEMATYTLKHSYKLPAFPFYQLMKAVAVSKVAYTAGDPELAEALADLSARAAELPPVLFLAAEEDTYIPYAYTQAAYEAYPGAKELLSAGVEHGAVGVSCTEEIVQALSNML